jgi:hypothetical protein
MIKMDLVLVRSTRDTQMWAIGAHCIVVEGKKLQNDYVRLLIISLILLLNILFVYPGGLHL